MPLLPSQLDRLSTIVSPRRREWARFLKGLPIDPDLLPRPLDSPSVDDFIICGCSRTGTSLLAALLFQPPGVATVMEPWDGMRMPPAALFRSLREEIATSGRLARGRLDLHAIEQGTVRWCREGEQAYPIRVAERYRLGVKWPVFWRYLEHLPETKFIVCLRHPVEVIASFKKAGGRLRRGLDYDTAFNTRMNQQLSRMTRDLALRRVLLFEYVHTRLLPHLDRPNVFLVRYERWFSDRRRLLDELSDFLGAQLETGKVQIRPAEQKRLTRRERRLIRAHCRTAEPLGYRL